MTSFFIVFINFVLVRLTLLLRNAIKTNVFLMILKTRCWSPFLTFAPFGALRTPPGPPLESIRRPFGPPGPPPKFRNGPLGAPRAPRGLQKACHWLTLGRKKPLRVNIDKLNFTQEKPYFWRSLVLTHSRSMCVMVCWAFFVFFVRLLDLLWSRKMYLWFSVAFFL